MGATQIAIFYGMMDANGFIEVLKAGLLPFIREKLPKGHRLMMDNYPKHTSRLARTFMEEGVNWWKTPPESPDCNPIENIWHELKGIFKKRGEATKKR